VNTARGTLIDEAALEAALRSGHLAGAGLDVVAEEPMTAAIPLLALDSVVVTPHVAASTAQGLQRMALASADERDPLLRRHLAAGMCRQPSGPRQRASPLSSLSAERPRILVHSEPGAGAAYALLSNKRPV
jgi:phosphoglycerate dehydrogenase-like enzyme